jgi:two-component system, NarL family, sensor histidine kinase DegS
MNVLKDSCAERVSVILAVTRNEALLIVEDDGHGFDADNMSGEPELRHQHCGLLGVRKRLALVDSSVEVEWSVPGGTTVYVHIPPGGRAWQRLQCVF